MVAGSARVPAPAGSVVAVPFALRHGGGGAPLDVSLGALTTLRGASVAPSPATLVPTGGEHQALVVVGVPASARRATHGVTLRATLPGGQTREATTRIAVRPPAEPLSVVRHAPRRVRLDWRDDRRADYYNLQVFSRARKVLSTFPGKDDQLLRLRPGRYRIVVWSGIGPLRPTRYAPRPWVNRMVKVAPGRSRFVRAKPLRVRLR